VLLALVVAAGVALSAPAHADGSSGNVSNDDSNAFFHDTAAAGFTGGVYAVGLEACTVMDSGWTPRKTVGYIATSEGLTDRGAFQLVNISAQHLCHFHSGQGFDEQRPWYGG
jgi:hypothetical protein